MGLIIGATGTNTQISVVLSGFIAMFLITCSSSTEWRGISGSEFQERSLKLGNDQANKVRSPERWKAKPLTTASDSLIQGSINHERILSLDPRVEKDLSLKQVSKSFKPSNVDKRLSNEQAILETTRSPYVLEIRYDDDSKGSSFLDLMGAGTRAEEKVPPEVIQVPLAGVAFSHSVPSSAAALRSNVAHRVEFPYARNISSTSFVSANASDSSNVFFNVNQPTSEATSKATAAQGEVQYHPHIPYKPDNVNKSKTENFMASNVDVFRQSLPDETDASSSTLAPLPSDGSPGRVSKKIVTKISPLGNTAADALGTNAQSKPSKVSGYKTAAQQLQIIDLRDLGHDADLKPHALLEEMRKLIAAHTPQIGNGHSSVVVFHKNKEMTSQGDVQTSHSFPSNGDRIRISTNLELPINPNQATTNSSPPAIGKPAASSLLSETTGNSLYVQSVTPSSVLGKLNQDEGKDVISPSAAKTIGLETPSASDGAKAPVQVKFHNKLIPVTAFIDPKSAPLPGVHFVLNPWVYKFPPWFEPHNPPPPGATSNSSDLLQGDIIIDLEDLQDSSNGDELVNVRVPSFSRFKDEVVRTILEANLKDARRKGKNVENQVTKRVGGNSLKSEVTSETHPEKVVSLIGDTEMNVELAAIKHSINHDLENDKPDFHSGKTYGIAPDEHQPASGSGEHVPVNHDTGRYLSDSSPKHGESIHFGGDASYEDDTSYSPHYDKDESPEIYTETRGSTFGGHPHRGHKNPDAASDYHDSTPYSSGRGTYSDGENFGSGERFLGDFHHSGEDEFDAYQEQAGGEYDSYPSAPVYGTPHYHIHTPYSVGYSGSHEDPHSYDNSDYNKSGERDSVGSDDEDFGHIKGDLNNPVYTSFHSGGNFETPQQYDSSGPTLHFKTNGLSSHHDPHNSNYKHYNENKYPGEDFSGEYENEPKGSPLDSGGFPHNHDSGGFDFYPKSSGNHDLPNTGRFRDSSKHFGNGGSLNNYNPQSEGHYFPQVGKVAFKSNPHYHSELDHSNQGNSDLVSDKVIFRDDTKSGKFGKHGIHDVKDYVGATSGKFIPSNGYRNPVLKPFKPSPLDPTSVPTSLLNKPPQNNHSPSGKLLEHSYRRPHSHTHKDKYPSVFVSRPQYLRSIYDSPGSVPSKYTAKYGTSKKPFIHPPALNSNYVLTPHKYYYDDHRSHPVMSSGHAVTYWVPSRHNFYRSPSRRHDLASSSSDVPKAGVVIGVHPATREDVGPSPKLLPPAVRRSEINSVTRLSEGVDLLPYFNALHRSKKRKNKLNISIPMSYSGTSLRNVSAIVDDSSTSFQKPSLYRRSKEQSSSGISVDIIYGSRKNSGPVSPHLVMKNTGSTQLFSKLIVKEESLHESKEPSSGGPAHGSERTPLVSSNPSVVRRGRQAVRGPSVARHGTPSAWYWLRGLQV